MALEFREEYEASSFIALLHFPLRLSSMNTEYNFLCTIYKTYKEAEFKEL